MIRFCAVILVRGFAAMLAGLAIPALAQPSSGDAGSAALSEPAPSDSGVSLGVEGFSAIPEDREPRVLYILPWQPPTIPERTQAELRTDFPDLMTPQDPDVLSGEIRFRQTLSPGGATSRFTPQ